MALLDAEVARLKAELGFNVLTIGAIPYIGYTSLFDQVIQPYMQAGASTTSATAVTAASSATPVTLTLTSATGFTSGCRVVIDVDDRQEIATTQNLSGTSLTVLLTLTHSGTYPVSVEGGETIVREKLRRIRLLNTEIDDAGSTAGIKRVDEIEFFGASGESKTALLYRQLDKARDELASILGLRNMHRMRNSGGQTFEMY